MIRDAASALGWTAGLAAVAAASILLSQDFPRSVPSAEAGPPTEASVGGGGRPGVATGAADDAEPTPELPGFRADAWFLPDDELLGFVEIPAGSVRMGSDPQRDPLAYDNERWSPSRAQATVDVPTFYIGRYEVTVAQYRAFVEATGHAVVDETALRGPPDHPVTAVSWTDALAYGRWLEAEVKASDRTPPELRRRLQDGWRVGLPSEPEWERAARGSDGRIFPWGDEPRPDRANYGAAGTAPVGSFECGECPFGLSDMSGNVWEWTRSPFQPYPFDPSNDRENLEADALWVMRGGAFNDSPQNVRAAVRGGADPGVRRPFIGFRVVVTRF